MTSGNIDEMSFEEAMTQLEEIVSNLESGDVKLADAISSYERGAALRSHCESILRKAQERVDLIRTRTGNAQMTTVPFEPEPG